MRYLLIVAIAFLVSSLGAAAELPRPKGLKQDIYFWELIFGTYNSSECVFHDSKYLEVIYGAKKIKKGSKRYQSRQIKAQANRIRGALKNLAKGRSPRSKVERQVYRATPKHLRMGRFYRRAANRIRCQRGIKDSFKKSLARSKFYLPIIRRVFKEKKLPYELAWLPHLESGFNRKAHSKVGARGLWQLMPATARMFKLKVNRYRDDRLKPITSTRAAAKILASNYKRIKSWPLAITGYNYGINGIARGVRRHKTMDYMRFRRLHKSRIFGFAAKNFYPSFLAVVNLAKRHDLAKKSKKKKGLLFATSQVK